MFCAKCGSQVALQAPFCPVCGTPQGMAQVVMPVVMPTIRMDKAQGTKWIGQGWELVKLDMVICDPCCLVSDGERGGSADFAGADGVGDSVCDDAADVCGEDGGG